MRCLAVALLMLLAATSCRGSVEPTATPTLTVAPSPPAPGTPVATSTPPSTVPPAPTATAVPTATPSPVPTATPSPPALTSARVVDRGPAARRFIALTFDAGSDAGYTEQILDTLRSSGVVASFGITGRWAEQHPELLRRIAREGHHLINHSYDHQSFTGLSTSRAPLPFAERQRQLARTEEVVSALAGAELRPYFRPPFGDYDASVNADLAALGYAYNVLWTVDSAGWRGIPAASIVERCLASAVPGAIYVFHVGAQSQDGAALPAVIDGLQSRGYALGSVPQLLQP